VSLIKGNFRFWSQSGASASRQWRNGWPCFL